MGKKKCKCDCPVCLPAWLAAFGDLMSLLLCFFVLLLSMSTMDAKKVSDAVGSLSGALSVLEGGMKTEISQERMQQATPLETTEETTDTVNKISSAATETNEMTKQTSGPAITIEEAEEGFMINLPAELLFKEKSVLIENEDAILFLKRIGLIFTQTQSDVDISIQGHTDNTQAFKPYKNNWEISTARAISVLQILEAQGVDPMKMGVTGYGAYRPRATNETPKGRAKNRRVEIHFIGNKPKQKDKAKQSILDAGIEVKE